MAKTKTKRRTKTKYQKLLSGKGRYCKGRITKADLNKLKKAYIDDAVKKGKTKSEATKIANKVVNGACSTTSKKKK